MWVTDKINDWKKNSVEDSFALANNKYQKLPEGLQFKCCPGLRLLNYGVRLGTCLSNMSRPQRQQDSEFIKAVLEPSHLNSKLVGGLRTGLKSDWSGSNTLVPAAVLLKDWRGSDNKERTEREADKLKLEIIRFFSKPFIRHLWPD